VPKGVYPNRPKPWLGKKFSHEHKERLRSSHLGKRPANYIQSDVNCQTCGKIFHKKPSHIHKMNFCSKECHNIFQKGDTKNKERLRELGRIRNRGLSKERDLIEQTEAYKNWRLSVFRRDSFSCVSCKQRGGSLHAHHISSFAKFPELRTDVNNGITLCDSCHRQLHIQLRKEAKNA
jgi:5-methylcytosine-specific restriction endonuclease McrA